ncbi:DUF1344 domain-containing protein [Jiella sp. M17.18]|uniref:DUF1344 domain-containing protein n=1 Tax=Jiella sp. M17.18 TaxID=3234247 RepID=UPI0034DE433F
MRTLLMTAAVAAGLAFAPAAFAATTHVATGTVKSVDATAMTVTLANGKSYHLPAKYSAGKLKAGEKVSITYHMNGTSMDASKITMSRTSMKSGKPAAKASAMTKSATTTK